jgi:hypothetical protein
VHHLTITAGRVSTGADEGRVVEGGSAA